MGMVNDFKEFAMRGNVIDMAVGIIVGGAFGKIVTSLTTTCLCHLWACYGAMWIFPKLSIALDKKDS